LKIHLLKKSKILQTVYRQAAEQQAENERLRHEVAVLAQQWQARQAQAGGHV